MRIQYQSQIDNTRGHANPQKINTVLANKFMMDFVIDLFSSVFLSDGIEKKNHDTPSRILNIKILNFNSVD